MLRYDEVVARLPQGKREGGRYRAPCPAHGGKDRNLSVWPGKNGVARFKCWSRGCSKKEIVAALNGLPVLAMRVEPRASKLGARKLDLGELARTIWRQTRPAPGTIVDDYLFGRGLTANIPASIRFHPALKHPSGVYLPAMIAAVEGFDGRIVGIHRTFLKVDGSGKAEVEPNKMALGSYSRCAVHLSAGGAVLVICEGIETGLSILQATGRHVWVALGTSNLPHVELPSFVRGVMIAADPDEPGMNAAIEAIASYGSRGYEVRIITPRNEIVDWNDVMRK